MKVQNLIMLLGVMALTSCVGLTQVTVPQSNVNIVGRDMETQRHVSYTLKKTYVFGIGGCSKRARNTNIIDELMKKANLQQNEALAYISVSKNVNNYAGVVTIAKFTASGYVVRPVGNAPVAATSTPALHVTPQAETSEQPDPSQVTSASSEPEQQAVEVNVSMNSRGKLVTFPDGTKGVAFAETENGELLVVSLLEQKLPFKEGKAWCKSLGEGWRMPTKYELLVLFKVANEGKGFRGPVSIALDLNGGRPLVGWYWCSVENGCKGISVVGGYQKPAEPNVPQNVRAVRLYKE